VQAAVRHLIARTRAAGKVAGIMSYDAAAWPDLWAQGVQMLAVGADSSTLTRALRALSQTARDSRP
jgi:4-hydroxy-2-oxoheptanedioate aldolase